MDEILKIVKKFYKKEWPKELKEKDKIDNFF